MSNTRARRWCFTLNNPTDEEIASLKTLSNEKYFRYIIFQGELGESGTPHLQGYFRFTHARALTTLKRIVSSRAHYEKSRGTEQECIQYCSKPETRTFPPFTFGDPSPNQGTRSDVATYTRLRDVVVQQGLLAVADLDFQSFLRHHRGLQTYLTLVLQNRSRAHRTELHIVLGAPGTGKTYWANEHYAPHDTYWKEAHHAWFDGYRPEQHQNCVIDEYLGQLPLTQLNRLVDSVPCSVKIHGGMERFYAQRIVIISNLHPRSWYPRTCTPLDSLYRRIDSLRIFEERNEEPLVAINSNTDRSVPSEEIMALFDRAYF